MTREPGSGDVCLDPGTLAAFADGTLSKSERATVEAHAADCARCLAMLATMARVQEPVHQPSRWRLPRFAGWVVPSAVAATAIALFVYIGGGSRPVVQQRSTATDQSAPAPAVQTTASAPTESLRADSEPRHIAQTPPPTERVEPKARASSARRAEQGVAALEDARPRAAAAEKPAPAAPPPQTTDQAGSARKQERLVEAVQPQTAKAAPVPPLPSADVAGASAAAQSRSGYVGVARQISAGVVHVTSPDAARAWRITSRIVERSNDGGVTWTVEPTPPTPALRAGASPAPAVCWLAGDAGTILRWTETQGWRHVSFPERVALTSIAATSADDADVTTADNRRFRTTDGGVTWVVVDR
jgi:hypothetical protein